MFISAASAILIFSPNSAIEAAVIFSVKLRSYCFVKLTVPVEPQTPLRLLSLPLIFFRLASTVVLMFVGAIELLEREICIPLTFPVTLTSLPSQFDPRSVNEKVAVNFPSASSFRLRDACPCTPLSSSVPDQFPSTFTA